MRMTAKLTEEETKQAIIEFVERRVAGVLVDYVDFEASVTGRGTKQVARIQAVAYFDAPPDVNVRPCAAKPAKAQKA